MGQSKRYELVVHFRVFVIHAFVCAKYSVKSVLTKLMWFQVKRGCIMSVYMGLSLL